MDKVYPVKELVSGCLQEVNNDNNFDFVKNVLGIVVEYNGESLFYSIFDDCFFRLFSKRNDLGILETGSVYVSVYGKYNQKSKPYGVELYNNIQKEYATKEDLINSNLMLYFSDLSYIYFKKCTNVDYEDVTTIEDNIINNELDYEQKLDRPIAYTDGLSFPSARKRVIKL